MSTPAANRRVTPRNRASFWNNFYKSLPPNKSPVPHS